MPNHPFLIDAVVVFPLSTMACLIIPILSMRARVRARVGLYLLVIVNVLVGMYFRIHVDYCINCYGIFGLLIYILNILMEITSIDVLGIVIQKGDINSFTKDGKEFTFREFAMIDQDGSTCKGHKLEKGGGGGRSEGHHAYSFLVSQVPHSSFSLHISIAEFRRTHADTWNVQIDLFTEKQLEVYSLLMLIYIFRRTNFHAYIPKILRHTWIEISIFVGTTDILNLSKNYPNRLWQPGGIDFIRIGRYEAVHEQIQENCLSVMDMGSTQEIKQKMDKTNVVAVTCLGISRPLLTNKRFDVCIMDEAGQITLPVSLGPLMFASKFVLVGDHYRLPPLVQSPEAKEKGMSVSLFCRLSEVNPRAIAVLHCQVTFLFIPNVRRHNGTVKCFDIWNRLRCGSSEIENAKVRYRCSASAPTWLMEVLNPNQPVIFINTDLVPAYETNDHRAVNNPTEAFIIAEVTKALLLRGIEGQDIGIITPYNSQANLIRGAVSEPVEIHTIDKYQGRDKDCILVSFVRSCENPRNNTTSLLGDWHRINVALTRAKKKLIMVGSCTTLSRVPLLKLLIDKVEKLSSMLVVSKKDINHKVELKRCSKFR
ncbi:hypothetical protein ACJIZ3_009405 [Penstemon smallii]|uniref:DNA replication ATP-dependent helicase/nuclease n=1 Tax=Penstemon smallii TaxID=265156 RepID=A0ABD3TCE4_9LAMI